MFLDRHIYSFISSHSSFQIHSTFLGERVQRCVSAHFNAQVCDLYINRKLVVPFENVLALVLTHLYKILAPFSLINYQNISTLIHSLSWRFVVRFSFSFIISKALCSTKLYIEKLNKIYKIFYPTNYIDSRRTKAFNSSNLWKKNKKRIFCLFSFY